MNPLEKYPHLFANGKFKLMYEDDVRDNWGLVNVNGKMLLAFRTFTVTEIPSNKEITLIARPISDMTDEEVYHFFESYAEGKGDVYTGMFDRDELIAMVTDTRKSSEQLLYLLSIGVYPFDQKHFEGGTVIDSTKI